MFESSSVEQNNVKSLIKKSQILFFHLQAETWGQYEAKKFSIY
jgi:hypothetical protein